MCEVDHPLDVGHQRDAFPVAEMSDPHLQVFPGGACGEAFEAREHKDDPDLPAVLDRLLDGGNEDRRVVVGVDLARSGEADDAAGEVAEWFEHVWLLTLS